MTDQEKLGVLRAAIADAVLRLGKRKPDHACAECKPRPRRGAGIKPGFKCVRHSLEAALRLAP